MMLNRKYSKYFKRDKELSNVMIYLDSFYFTSSDYMAIMTLNTMYLVKFEKYRLSIFYKVDTLKRIMYV